MEKKQRKKPTAHHEKLRKVMEKHKEITRRRKTGKRNGSRR